LELLKFYSNFGPLELLLLLLFFIHYTNFER
jgi:hypothetical protein